MEVESLQLHPWTRLGADTAKTAMSGKWKRFVEKGGSVADVCKSRFTKKGIIGLALASKTRIFTRTFLCESESPFRRLHSLLSYPECAFLF
jgi:hypothetical protein